MKKIVGLALVAVLLSAARVDRAHAQANEESICDFEGAQSMKVWEPGPEVSFAAEHATEGARAAKVSFTAPLIASDVFPKDWAAHKALTVDVFNPGGEALFTIRMADSAGKEYVIDPQVVPAGVSGLTIDLIDVSVKLDMTAVTAFSMTPKEGAPVLFLDNMRFLAIAPKAEWVIVDFENPMDLTYFDLKRGSIELSKEHATSGRSSLKLSPDTYMIAWKMPTMWSGYDALEADFFNDTGQPVALHVLVGDKAWADSIPKGMSYWNRHNTDFAIPPGPWTFSLSVTGMYRGHVGSRFNDLKTCIDPGNIIRIDFGVGKASKGAVYMDNIRLVKAYIPEGVWAFDFGPESQVRQPGFKPVTWNTVYDEDVGYGLRRKVIQNRARDDTFPSKLYRDYLQFDDGAEFLVRVPKGRYHVSVVFDDCGYWGGEAVRSTKRHIEAEGEACWSEDRGERGGYWAPNYHFENTEPLPGDDFWELYMSYIFEPKEFAVEVTDGRLDLKVVADAPWSTKVACVIIYPEQMKTVGAKFVSEVMAGQRAEFSAAAAEIPTPVGGTLAAVPEAEKEKGWLFWLTDYEKETYLTTVPAPEQIARTTSIFATLGEFEPVTFAVRPLRDLGEARVTVSEFSCGEAKIPASAWDVRVVRHLSRRAFSAISYNIIPQMLKHFDAVELPADLTREFWATVRVPGDAEAGEYEGSIRITSDGGLDETLKIRLTVLPFKLGGSDYVFGFFGAPPNEQVGRMLLEHGMNSFSGGPRIGLSGWDEENKPILDFARVDGFMERIRRGGFSQEICGYGGPGVGHIGYQKDEAFFGAWEKKTGMSYVELMKSVFDEVKAHSEEAGWLPFTYNLGDETRNPDYAKTQVMQIKAIQEAAPWLKTTAQYSVSYRGGSDPKNYHQWIFEALKTSGLNSHDESVMEKARELGKEVYIYNQGQSRYSFGAYQWSEYVKGVRGRYQWHIHIQHGFQFFDLDGREPDTGVIYYGAKAPIPTLAFERCREGADDFYYCQTLANVAARAKTPLAAEAKAMLKSVTDRIGISERRQPDWLDNDKLRADCAAYTLKLMGEPVPGCLTANPAPKRMHPAPPQAKPVPPAEPQEAAAPAGGFPAWAIGLIVVGAGVLAVIVFFAFKRRR